VLKTEQIQAWIQGNTARDSATKNKNRAKPERGFSRSRSNSFSSYSGAARAAPIQSSITSDAATRDDGAADSDGQSKNDAEDSYVADYAKAEKERATRYLTRISRAGKENEREKEKGKVRRRRTKEEKEDRKKARDEQIAELIRQRDERTREVFGDGALVIDSDSMDEMTGSKAGRAPPRHYDELRHLLGSAPSRSGLRDWPRRFSAEQQSKLFKLLESISIDYGILEFDSSMAAEALDKFRFEIDYALKWLVKHGRLPQPPNLRIAR